MARLERGESELIDKINDLVAIAKSDKSTKDQRNEALTELLKLFKPLILKLCNKWSQYFNDDRHNIKRFNELVADAEFWFMKYTLDKYEIGGSATFNTFIKNHLDQRIRYIYECELKYYNRHIFPDPDRKSDNEDTDMFDSVVYNYSSSSHTVRIEDDIIEKIYSEDRTELAKLIINIVNTNQSFSERERDIFISIMCGKETQSDVGNRLGISRTRITQIMKKTKIKLYKLMDNNEDIWRLITKLNLDFEELMIL